MQLTLVSVSAGRLSLTALFELHGILTFQPDRSKVINCLIRKIANMQMREERYDNLRVLVQYLVPEDFQQADATVRTFASLKKVPHVATPLEELFCQMDEPYKIRIANLLALLHKKPAANFLLGIVEHAQYRHHLRKHFIKALFFCHKLLPKERLQKILNQEKSAFNRAQLQNLILMRH